MPESTLSRIAISVVTAVAVAAALGGLGWLVGIPVLEERMQGQIRLTASEAEARMRLTAEQTEGRMRVAAEQAVGMAGRITANEKAIERLAQVTADLRQVAAINSEVARTLTQRSAANEDRDARLRDRVREVNEQMLETLRRVLSTLERAQPRSGADATIGRIEP